MANLNLFEENESKIKESIDLNLGKTENKIGSISSNISSVKDLLSTTLKASLKISSLSLRGDNSGIIDFAISLDDLNLNLSFIKENKCLVYNHFYINGLLPIVISQNIDLISSLISEEMDLEEYSDNFEDGKTFYGIKRNGNNMLFAIHVSRFNQYFLDQFKREFVQNSNEMNK